jgi:hypothetical protein
MNKLTAILVFHYIAAQLKRNTQVILPLRIPLFSGNKFATASQKINSVQSDFVQEKNLSMLSEKIVSKGKFWFKKITRCAWNTTSLFNT